MSKDGAGGEDRAERLRAALRENLRRRKAQDRGRAAGPGDARAAGDGAGDAPAPLGPDSDKTGL